MFIYSDAPEGMVWEEDIDRYCVRRSSKIISKRCIQRLLSVRCPLCSLLCSVQALHARNARSRTALPPDTADGPGVEPAF